MTSHEGEDPSNFLIDLNTAAFWHEWCSVPNEDNTNNVWRKNVQKVNNT